LQSVAVAAFWIVSWNKDVIVELVLIIPLPTKITLLIFPLPLASRYPPLLHLVDLGLLLDTLLGKALNPAATGELRSMLSTPSTVAWPPSSRQLFAAVGCSLVPFTSLVWCVLTPAVL